ncbi:trypsin-like serine protease [Photobacterium leiognathi]|uniref:trypsin-like serine protease n=1 Tax=Photobacterium leiognathi TaxID=553611 RepID=UPI0034E5F20D
MKFKQARMSYRLFIFDFAAGGMCSGSMSDNHIAWILTAAHCIKIEHDDNNVLDGSYRQYYVFKSNYSYKRYNKCEYV